MARIALNSCLRRYFCILAVSCKMRNETVSFVEHLLSKLYSSASSNSDSKSRDKVMHTVWAWRMLVVQGCRRCCIRMLAGVFSPLWGRKGTYCQLLNAVSKATSFLRHNQRRTTNNQIPSNKDECLANPMQIGQMLGMPYDTNPIQ